MTLEAHRDADRMARCLVSYIACDKRVRHEILSEFDCSPGLMSIASIRRRKQEAAQRESDPAMAGWDWKGEQANADMEMASTVFVRALLRERGQ